MKSMNFSDCPVYLNFGEKLRRKKYGNVFLSVTNKPVEYQRNPQVKGDGEAEQELYDKYKCWCTKVINSKTASIASNTARIQELSTSA